MENMREALNEARIQCQEVAGKLGRAESRIYHLTFALDNVLAMIERVGLDELTPIERERYEKACVLIMNRPHKAAGQ